MKWRINPVICTTLHSSNIKGMCVSRQQQRAFKNWWYLTVRPRTREKTQFYTLWTEITYLGLTSQKSYRIGVTKICAILQLELTTKKLYEDVLKYLYKNMQITFTVTLKCKVFKSLLTARRDKWSRFFSTPYLLTVYLLFRRTSRGNVSDTSFPSRIYTFLGTSWGRYTTRA